MSTHNIHFCGEIKKKVYQIPLLFEAVCNIFHCVIPDTEEE